MTCKVVYLGGSEPNSLRLRLLSYSMGGRIQVDNNYGEGAIFRFFIQSMSTDPTPPPSPSPLSPSNEISNALWSPISSNTSELAMDSVQYHILITEDNLINQASSSTSLSSIIQPLLTRHCTCRRCSSKLFNRLAVALQSHFGVRSLPQSPDEEGWMHYRASEQRTAVYTTHPKSYIRSRRAEWPATVRCDPCKLFQPPNAM